jgi:hypothetical protein
MRVLLAVGLGLMLVAAGAARAAAPDFDARRSADVAGVVTSNGASGSLKPGSDGKIYFDGQAGQLYFSVNFQDCDDKRTACNTAVFNGSWNAKNITTDQINRWNRWTLFCPAYLDTDGSPDMWYSVAVSQHTDRADIVNDVTNWMGCLKDFDSFIGGPDDFLKRNESH